MNWRRVGIGLMAIGLLFAVTSSYGAALIDADRVGEINSVTDSADSEDGNFFDTADATQSFTTIDDGADRVLVVFNHFSEPLTATRTELLDIQPVNESATNTTTNSSAVQVVAGDNTYNEDDTVDPDGDGDISLTCNPEFTETVDAEHELTVAVAVEGGESGTRFSLERTVTANVECNV